MVFKYVIICLISYMIGSISSGTLISKMYSNIDISKVGSGNSGTTNVLRTIGWRPSLFTFICDVLKGFVCTLVGLWVAGEGGAIACGIAVIVGHNWPILFGFKGGKGIATSFGAILVLQPLNALILLLVVIVVVFLTRTMSIGSLCAALTYLVLNLFQSLGNIPMLIFAIVVSALAFYTHRANIGRLMKGTENKLDFAKINKLGKTK